MRLIVDVQFVQPIGQRVRNFKKQSEYTWRFSCPLCGDSTQHKWKAHCYLYRWKDGLFFKCHRCTEGGPIGRLIKSLDQGIHDEYQREIFKEKQGPPRPVPPPAPKVYNPPDAAPILKGLPSIRPLGRNHPCRQYIEGRKIPELFFNQLFWADDFSALINKMHPGKYNLRAEGRIVIPFLDVNYRLLALQGRSIEPDAEVRYITIKSFADAPRVYGLHRLEKTAQNIYIVEGAFDSLFLPNGLAMAGGDIPRGISKDKCVIVYDNEPGTLKKVELAINKGFRVVIWPDLPHKDINEMILAGMTAEHIKQLIDENSYRGLEATFRLSKRRIAH